MTICIGLLASDGVVIASDAEESDTYFKRPQQKILPWFGGVSMGGDPKPPKMVCAFTGAGQSGYIDAFISEALKGISPDWNSNELETFLAEKTLAFHERHLFPLAHTPEPPQVSMLIGASCGFQTTMFVTHGSTLRRPFPHVAVGYGAHFALSLIGDLVEPGQDIKHMEIVATHIVAVVKERIEGCGKYTTVVSLHRPQLVEGEDGGPAHLVSPASPLTYVPAATVNRWEESFSRKWSPRQVGLLRELVEEELQTVTPSTPQMLEGQ